MKKISFLLMVILLSIVVVGCDIDSTNTSNTSSNKNVNQQTTTTETKEEDYMDALRKCAVMEAADIYTTGVGKKSVNVFNDGRETCEGFYKQWGEKDFVETINMDWENRKNEQIDGQPLTHYLDVLGW